MSPAVEAPPSRPLARASQPLTALPPDTLARRIWRHRRFYLFISPFFILFGVFGLYPLGFSLYLSFVSWDALTEPVWVGWENFRTLVQDRLCWVSLRNTLVLGLLYVPPMLGLAFVFALILNQQWIRFRAAWRAAVFIPVITPGVVVAIVFGLMFGTEFGLFNQMLRTGADWLGFSFGGIPWLESENWSKPSIAILLVWRWTGYNMVIMLAGLQGIDRTLYEAASIDGASRFRQLLHVTIPHMRGTFIFVSIMSLIGTVYLFDEVFVMTRGGPGISSTTFGLFLFDEAFGNFRFGYASAAAYTVALAVFLTTMLIFRANRSAND
jgi:ABC-type sugar transport system permease subunit